MIDRTIQYFKNVRRINKIGLARDSIHNHILWGGGHSKNEHLYWLRVLHELDKKMK